MSWFQVPGNIVLFKEALMWEALKSNVLSVLEDSGSYSLILIFRLCRIFLFAVPSIVYRSHYCQTLSNVAK